MAGKNPIVEQAYNPNDTTPTPWAEARERLETSGTYWLATMRPNGQPHVVPLLAVWTNDTLHFAASPTTRKAGNLAHNAHCVVTTSNGGLDLVVEGTATKVTDGTRLHHVAGAYASKYGWQVEVRDGAFYAEGAPTAGPPPYEVYEITPTVAFGFPNDAAFTPTRWRF